MCMCASTATGGIGQLAGVKMVFLTNRIVGGFISGAASIDKRHELS